MALNFSMAWIMDVRHFSDANLYQNIAKSFHDSENAMDLTQKNKGIKF